jgi:predicted metal-binding membrane protein
MNLLCVAAIAAFILLEKTLPLAEIGARLVGAATSVVGLVSVLGLAPLG